jgi:hypothetical protein
MKKQLASKSQKRAATNRQSGSEQRLVSLRPSCSTERWYRNQGKRWGALEAGGWRFEMPRKREGTIGIVMARDGLRAKTLRVSSDLEFREIHTQLLAAVERWAKANNGSDPRARTEK